MVASELLLYETVVVCKSDNRPIMKFPEYYCFVNVSFDLRNFLRKYDVLRRSCELRRGMGDLDLNWLEKVG